MAYYRFRPDGLAELDTPAGPLALPTTEEELRANGHVPDHLSMTGSGSGATALNDVPQGRRNVTRADIERSASNREMEARAQAEKEKQLAALPQPPSGGRRNVTQADIQQAEVARNARAAIESPPKAEDEKGKTLRGGGSVVDDSKLRQPEREPERRDRSGGVVRVGPAGFEPVARTIKPGVEGLEDSIDTQNLQRQEQYRIERDAVPAQKERIERQSAEVGRNIRAEEQALAEERDRRIRINNDLQERQNAIDEERGKIENLQVRPRDIFAGKGNLASALAAITMIGGAIGQAYKGGPNLATEALNKAVDDEIADQKEAIQRRNEGLRVRQTELGRLTDLYGSPEAAEQEFRIRAHTLIQRKAEKDALDAGATDALANLQARWAKDNVGFEQQKLQLRGQLGDQISQQERYSSGLVATGPGKAKEGDVHQYAADLEKAGIGESEGKLGAVKDLITELPADELPTLETRNKVSRKFREVADEWIGQGTGARVLDTEGERRAVAHVERIKGDLRHELSGAAVNENEQKLLERQLDQINTKQGLLEFANDLSRKVERRKAGIRAGIAPEAVETYEGRKRAYDLPQRSGNLRRE